MHLDHENGFRHSSGGDRVISALDARNYFEKVSQNQGDGTEYGRFSMSSGDHNTRYA